MKNTIFKYDRVIQIKEYDKLKMVGEIFEVGDINDKSVIIRDRKTKVALAAIDIIDFFEYFTKQENSDDKTKWTEWAAIIDIGGQLIGYYRTNNKRVKVKTIDNIKSESTCHKCDKFDLRIGINLALERCNMKRLHKIENEIADRINSLRCEKHLSENRIRSLIKNVKSVEE